MWDLAVREEDYEAADAMLQRYTKRAPPLSYRIVPPYARGDSSTFTRLREELRALDARQSQIAARYMATYLLDLDRAEELARLDLQPRRNASIRLGAQTFLAWLAVARGRWHAAKAAFDSAARMEGGQAVQTDRAIAATLPFLDVPRADLETIRRGVEQWDPGSETQLASAGLAVALRQHLRLYLLGLLSSRLGDASRASLHAQELERLSVPEQARNVATGLVATLRADAALRSGQTDAALRALDGANGEIPLELVYVRPFVNVREYTQEHARFLRAEALLTKRRMEEARRWLETSFQGSQSEMVYLAPVHRRLAQIAEERGDRTKAVEHLSAFVTLWHNADPALQSHVTEARKALNRLGSR